MTATLHPAIAGADVILDVRNGKATYSYNVAIGQNVDILKTGIIDPTKVNRGALQNTASIAYLPKKHPPPAPAPAAWTACIEPNTSLRRPPALHSPRPHR